MKSHFGQSQPKLSTDPGHQAEQPGHIGQQFFDQKQLGSLFYDRYWNL